MERPEPDTTQSVDQLLRENRDLRHRLEELEETVRALRHGEADPLLVEAGGGQVHTLEAVDRPYRLLVEQVPRGAATLTAEGAIIYCNRGFSELLRRPIRSLRGQPIVTFAAPESQPRLATLLRDGQAAEVQGEISFQRGDGTPVPVYLGVSPLQEGALGLCLMVADVTEQRRDQDRQHAQELLDSERRFREMIDALPVAVYTTDAEGLLTHFNPASVELSGRVPVVGTDRWCVSWRMYRPDGSALPHEECAMTVALREGRAVRGAETIGERPDGTRFWFMPYPTPLFDAQGRVAGGINMLLDITERKEAEKAAALLAAIVDSSDDAVISKDLHGVITSWNKSAERLFGYPAEEVIGRSIRILIPEERQSEESDILSRLQRGERVDHFETIRVRKDGASLHISLTISPIRAGAGRIIGISKIARDITERKRVEAALRDADRRKDEFLATLAHELRNPLAPIRNAVEILKASDVDHPDLEWGRDVLDRQVQLMARLLDDLLDVSRISRHQFELHTERVELASVVEIALETSRPLIDVGGHELTVSLPPEPVHLDADPLRLSQVFANLLNNAAKYTEQRGRIRLSAEKSGGEVTVAVADSGIGITAEMLPRIFEIFSQAESAQARSKGGLGVGLSLVKGLVELHGGSIDARSDGPDQGSTFVVHLPVAGEAPPAAAQRPGEDGERAPASTGRVLVADDNRDSADSLARLLKSMGYVVGTAYDGEQAVEAAAALRPDVALVDIGMPKLSGYDACRRIREEPWGRGIFLIALTGWGQEADRRRTEEAGFDRHIVKPVDPAALVEALSARPRAAL